MAEQIVLTVQQHVPAACMFAGSICLHYRTVYTKVHVYCIFHQFRIKELNISAEDLVLFVYMTFLNTLCDTKLLQLHTYWLHNCMYLLRISTM